MHRSLQGTLHGYQSQGIPKSHSHSAQNHSFDSCWERHCGHGPNGFRKNCCFLDSHVRTIENTLQQGAFSLSSLFLWFFFFFFFFFAQRLGQVGARALILSPTRELALQTLKFVTQIGHFMNLRSCLLVGGDSMEQQFADLSLNPDMWGKKRKNFPSLLFFDF